MTLRILGAIIILSSCGGFGFSMVKAYQREERCLQALSRSVEWMICQLEYSLMPLPQLIRSAAGKENSPVGQVFTGLANRLETQRDTDASAAMTAILEDFENLPLRTRLLLQQFGVSLGKFSLSGQISCLHGIAQLCQREQNSLSNGREARLRSYRTLGLCAGAALVILFL